MKERVRGPGWRSKTGVGMAGKQDEKQQDSAQVEVLANRAPGIQDWVGVLGFWSWVLSPPSPAAAPGCGDGRGAAFLRAQVPAGSQDLASPATATAPAMPGLPQGPHLPPWAPHYLQQEVCEFGFLTAPNSPLFLLLPFNRSSKRRQLLGGTKSVGWESKSTMTENGGLLL